MPIFHIPVLTVAESQETVRVKANSEKEAKQMAIEVAKKLPFFPDGFGHRASQAVDKPKPNRTVLAEPVMGLLPADLHPYFAVKIPGQRQPVEPLRIDLDYYGEKSPRFQLMLHKEGDQEGDLQVALRFNKDGKLAEVYVADTTVQVVLAEGVEGWVETTKTPPSDWIKERDGR